jgi:cell division protein FtsA
MTGVRLETDTHIITGSSTSMRNLVKCVSQVGIDVNELVFSGLASAEAVLTETEKELGVILVDIGGETTDIVIFVDGSIAYSAVVPIGGRHITSDLAVGLRVSLESAEKIKLSLGKILKTPVVAEGEPAKKKEENMLDVKALGIIEEDVQKISQKAAIDGIIKPRLQELYKYIGKEIKKSGFGTLTPSGLVICGGGAETVGAIDQAKYVLGFPARIGKIEGLGGLIDEIDSPAFATAAGLILYGTREGTSGNESRMPSLGKGIPLKGMLQKGVSFVKSFLP